MGPARARYRLGRGLAVLSRWASTRCSVCARRLRRSVASIAGRCRNVRLLRIGIPVRVSLSSRLTLGRLALPRNPCPCGVRVSRPHYRYLCLHLLFRALHHCSRNGFAAPGMLPYRSALSAYPAPSAPPLMPDYHQRAAARPVSCYALFEWVAASKPTSWLSQRLHLFCST